MSRKRREPSPPPPPPPQEEYSEESSSAEEEEEAPQKPPQNPKPPPTNDSEESSSDEEQGEEEFSDSEDDAEAFQLRQVNRSPSKPSAAPDKLESGADGDDDEEEGESSDDPEPIEKKAAVNLRAEVGKKRIAPEPISPGKAKKAKAKVEKAPPEPSPPGKAKKDKSSAEKTASELTPSGKAKKLKAEPERTALDPLSPSKSRKLRKWTTKDEIIILQAVIGHLKTKGTQPSAADLIAAVGDSLGRGRCSRSEMYEKVRTLKHRYEKTASTGALPSEVNELQKHKLSEAIWGENSELALPSISQKDGASSKSKKGHTNKERMDVHSKGGTSKEAASAANVNGGTQTGSKKGHATKEKINIDSKSRSSKKASTTDIPAKDNKHGNNKQEPVEGAKLDSLKANTTAATKYKMEEDTEDLGPKEATVATQNVSTLTVNRNGGTQKGLDIGANTQGIHKGLNELQKLYPNLTFYMQGIKAQHPCGETLMRAFQFIDEHKASNLEAKIKNQRKAELKMGILQAETRKKVTELLIGLLD